MGVRDGVKYALLLWGEAFAKGYTSALWMTYKQAAELGAQVRKGEHGALVVYADRITKTEHNERGENVERSIPFMKGYTVFNVEQVDGLPAHYYAKPEPKGDPLPLIEAAERFFTQTGARFQHGGDRAFYAPARDFIQLPPAEAFTDAESYAATKAHELIHWTPGAGWCSGPLTIQPGGARTRGQLEELSTGARRCWRWGTAVPKAIHTLVVWMGRLSTAARSATTGTL